MPGKHKVRLSILVTAALFSVLFFVVSHILKQGWHLEDPAQAAAAPGLVKLAEAFFHEAMMAALVAGVIAVVFDLTVHRALAKDLVTPIQEGIETSTGSLQEQVRMSSEEVQRGVEIFVKHNELVSRALENDLLAIYQRHDPRSKDAVSDAIRELAAHRGHPAYLFVCVRSHRRAFDQELRAWMTPLLAEVTGNPNVRIAMLLPNAFAQESYYREEVERFRHARKVHDTRQTAHDVLHAADAGRYASRLALRFTDRVPPYALIMTPQRAFLEQYLPTREGGSMPVFEFGTRTDSAERAPQRRSVSVHAALAADFATVFREATPAAAVLNAYVSRKRAEAGSDANVGRVVNDFAETAPMSTDGDPALAELIESLAVKSRPPTSRAPTPTMEHGVVGA